jgi:ABC-2 type transport system permease protein
VTEYPIWLVCGFLVPIALLPEWVRPISWARAPTLQYASVPCLFAMTQTIASERYRHTLGCMAVGVAYLAAGFALLSFFETRSRRVATLEIA